MRLLDQLPRLMVVATLCLPSCLSLPADSFRVEERATGSLASFIATESPIALQGVLNNVGSAGSAAQGAKSGIVVASPSTTNPNCKLAKSGGAVTP